MVCSSRGQQDAFCKLYNEIKSREHLVWWLEKPVGFIFIFLNRIVSHILLITNYILKIILITFSVEDKGRQNQVWPSSRVHNPSRSRCSAAKARWSVSRSSLRQCSNWKLQVCDLIVDCTDGSLSVKQEVVTAWRNMTTSICKNGDEN